MVILLRWVLLIAVSYLVVLGAPRGLDKLAAGCVVLFLASNLILMRLPTAAFHHKAFDPVLVLADISLVTLALWLCGTAGGDFFFIFFFVVFLAALGERPELTAIGAVLAAVAYLAVLHHGPLWDSAVLLRVPFLFITALTYGYLASVTREARARAQAAEAVLDLKKHFLATMSHEMRTPLNVIVGFGEMLREGALDPLSLRQLEGVQKIQVHAFELLALIDRTLKASRLESGGIELHLDTVALPRLMEEVEMAVGPYQKPDVRLTFRTGPGIPPLVTDRLKVKEVVTNLVTNALKYTAQGTVAVDARWPAQDGFIEILVQDTGIGIPPERQSEIFDLFTRAPEVETSCVPGVGLGLYIVRRLLDMLHGELRLESERGRGSTFTVRLPRTLEATTDAA